MIIRTQRWTQIIFTKQKSKPNDVWKSNNITGLHAIKHFKDQVLELLLFRRSFLKLGEHRLHVQLWVFQCLLQCHTWTKSIQITAVKHNIVGEVVSADKELCMSEQTKNTNKRLKFVTTKISQETRYISIYSSIHMRCNVLACFFFAIFQHSSESSRLYQQSEFPPQSLQGSTWLTKWLKTAKP